MNSKIKIVLSVIALIAIGVGCFVFMKDVDLSARGLYDWYKGNMNYGVITLLMAIESSIIPLPSEVVVPPAAYFALLENSELNIWLVILFATVGATLGALVNYGVSMLIGRPLVFGFADSKIGHMLMLNSQKMEYAESYFQRKGAISIFFGRLLPAVRHLISIPAGLARMNVVKFLGYTFVGAALWNFVLAGMGYLLYMAVPDENKFFDALEHYNGYVKAVGYFLILLIAIYIYYKYKKNKQASKDNTK